MIRVKARNHCGPILSSNIPCSASALTAMSPSSTSTGRSDRAGDPVERSGALPHRRATHQAVPVWPHLPRPGRRASRRRWRGRDGAVPVARPMSPGRYARCASGSSIGGCSCWRSYCGGGVQVPRPAAQEPGEADITGSSHDNTGENAVRVVGAPCQCLRVPSTGQGH